MKSWVVLLTSCVCIISSLVLNLKTFINASFVREVLTINDTLYKHDNCTTLVDDSSGSQLLWDMVTRFFGLFLPLILIVVVYVLMYRKLRKEELERQESTNGRQGGQAYKISRTFVAIVLIFSICTIPNIILEIILYYRISGHEMNEDSAGFLSTAHKLFGNLAYFNCCLNPVFYSKVHVRIIRIGKRIWTQMKKYRKDR